MIISNIHKTFILRSFIKTRGDVCNMNFVGQSFLAGNPYKQAWNRQFLNLDFLKFEKKRIKDVQEWYASFLKARCGDKLSEVCFYSIPIDLDSSIKAAIALKGKYSYIGLSALRNNAQFPLLLLIPDGKSISQEYSMLRIINPRKDFIHNERNNRVEYVLIADDFEELDSSYVYVDVPYEKRSITQFIKENLTRDVELAKSLQPTISGAPYVMNDRGGISLSAFMQQGTFSREFLRTLKMMQPPEFTDLCEETYTSGKFSVSKGMNLILSNKALPSKNFFTAFSSANYSLLNAELVKRQLYNGEYSIACGLIPKGGNPSELLQDILSKFVKTEVTRSSNFEELNQAGILLSSAQDNIDENLWLQIVDQRQNQPTINLSPNEESEWLRRVRVQWSAIMEALNLKDASHEARVYTTASMKNIKKVAQSISREKHKQVVQEAEIRESFEIFAGNSLQLTENNLIQHAAITRLPQMYENAKFKAVRAELSVDKLSITELFQNVKEYFKNLEELQTFTEKLRLSGFIFEPKQGTYYWVY